MCLPGGKVVLAPRTPPTCERCVCVQVCVVCVCVCVCV